MAACETAVEVDVPIHDPQLVATAFFTSDSLWAVRVESSVDYTSHFDPAPVNDAVVEILSEGRVLETLAYSDTGRYVGVGSRPAIDREYTLRVTAPGFDQVEGADRLPEPPHVASFRERSTGSRTIEVGLDLVLEDPAGADNYYGLFVVQSRWEFKQSAQSIRPLPPTLTTFESADEALDDGLLDFLDRDLRLYRMVFFDDATFDGAQKSLTLRLAYEAPDQAAELQIRRGFALVLVTVSKPLFDYWKGADRQIVSNENPFAEPVRIESNMSNGFGVFGGFQYRIYPLISTCRSIQPPLSICDSLETLGGGIFGLPLRIPVP
jgi:hypothetical protein